MVSLKLSPRARYTPERDSDMARSPWTTVFTGCEHAPRSSVLNTSLRQKEKTEEDAINSARRLARKLGIALVTATLLGLSFNLVCWAVLWLWDRDWCSHALARFRRVSLCQFVRRKWEEWRGGALQPVADIVESQTMIDCSTQTEVICYRCQELGHIQRNCPKRGEGVNRLDAHATMEDMDVQTQQMISRADEE